MPTSKDQDFKPPSVESADSGPLVPGDLESESSSGRRVHRVPTGMRDWLPKEARRRAGVSDTLMGNLDLFGYQRVDVPQFDYAAVWQSQADAPSAATEGVIRFVEAESGEVIALRPDVTPQIARLVATRFNQGPWPARFCYHATVTRRRRERARLSRQMTQVGFELIGRDELGGDLEVLEAATSGLRSAGVDEFTVDLAHAQIAGSLLEPLAPERRSDVLECLAIKDSKRLGVLAQRGGLSNSVTNALVALPELYGGSELWAKAENVLAGTPAADPLRSLEAIWRAATAAKLAPKIVVDLGETRDFHYYTGAMFQLLAEGPGEPLGSGGRYDNLFRRFDVSLPAAGFAFDLTNVCWALDTAGKTEAHTSKVLVVREPGASSEQTLAVLRKLRGLNVSCTRGPRDEDFAAYAARWNYSHTLELKTSHSVLTQIFSSSASPDSQESMRTTQLEDTNSSAIAEAVSAQLER